MTNNDHAIRFILSTTAFLLFAQTASAVVDIDWVTVGNPGNACDTQLEGCFGSVAEPYRISKLEITNSQYAEFLNMVAATDTFGLWSTGMAGGGSGFGGISRTGTSGNYTYAPLAGRENRAVNFVSFWSSARFANWLHNGQPTGLQDDTTTEDGAYTLTPTAIANNTVVRNPGAKFFITSEDEWYKAAYYDTNAMIYFDYPAGSDTQMTCAIPGATPNIANCDGVFMAVADVGSYPNAASPVGTFDQGGNLHEWNETIMSATTRGLRGGGHLSIPSRLAADIRTFGINASRSIGIRIASPSPVGLPSMGPLSLALVLITLAVAGHRRIRALHSSI